MNKTYEIELSNVRTIEFRQTGGFYSWRLAGSRPDTDWKPIEPELFRALVRHMETREKGNDQ